MSSNTHNRGSQDALPSKTWSTFTTSCYVMTMRIPRTQVEKRGTEKLNPCMLEWNSWISTDGQVTGMSHNDSHPRLWMTMGRLVSVKFTKMTRCSKWTPYREKFFEKSFCASSSQNQIWDGVGSEKDDAPEQKGFWDGVDLHFGAIDTTNVNKRERKREGRKRQSEKLQTVQIY